MIPRNPFIVGLRGQRSRSWGTRNCAGVCYCTLVSAGFF